MTPVQRVMRYKIQLEDIIRNTHPDDHSFPLLKDALKSACSLASFIDSHVEQQHGLELLLSIPSKIKGCPVSFTQDFDFNNFYRILLHLQALDAFLLQRWDLMNAST